MGPPRKPKNGLDKPIRKSAGTPREDPKEKLPWNVATNDKKTSDTGLQDPKNNTTTEKHALRPDTETAEVQDLWQTVHGNRGHLLQSDTQKKDIARILPVMENIFRKNKTADEKKKIRDSSG